MQYINIHKNVAKHCLGSKKIRPCERFVQNAQVRRIFARFHAKNIVRLPQKMVAHAINLIGVGKPKLLYGM